jgi:hypothetical protein
MLAKAWIWWNEIPGDLEAFSLITGFFCSTATLYRDRSPFCHVWEKARGASSLLAAYTALAAGVFISLTAPLMNLLYYLVSLLAGAALHKILWMFLSIFGRFGDFANISLHLLSGPAVIFAAWVFYHGSLLDQVGWLSDLIK